MKKKIVFVCEHPLSTSGNGGMMAGMLSQLNKEEYDAILFSLDLPKNYNQKMAMESLPCNIISANDGNDKFGKQKLLDFLCQTDCDIVLFVGHDIWQYAPIYTYLNDLQNNGKRFKVGVIFPWDIQNVRQDWVRWMNLIDFPCVYSKHGLDTLKPYVQNIRYYRPILHSADKWNEIPAEKTIANRMKMFPGLASDAILFGFVGVNQIRKDIQRLLKGFSIAVKKNPKMVLYLHTEMNVPYKYNLLQYAKDCEIPTGNLMSKTQGRKLTLEQMVVLFNTFDCLINCSLQEGLSWTVLEAMLCGVPVIASDTTAQTELVKDVGILVPNTIPTYQPLVGEMGGMFIDALACDPNDIADAMLTVAGDAELRATMKTSGLIQGKRWLEGVSNVNDLLKEMIEFQQKVKIQNTVKKDEVLFVQHSSAGDVLMTTQCFKGIKERHKGKKLVYMTQKKYHGIIEGNPYIDKIIDWDTNESKNYNHVYNPHGERVAPGRWGRNANTLLADFYWKLLDVEPCGMFIDLVEPKLDNGILKDNIDKNKKMVIVHTTGGAPKYRTYKYMKDVCNKISDKNKDFFTVQVGSSTDYLAGADIDLRGGLTYRETAWLISKASYAITVDSFVSHLTGILGVPQICLFGTGNASVVRPKQKENTLICLSPDYIRYCPGLGPCSGVVDCDCPCCTSIHSPDVVYNLLEELMKDGTQSIVKFYFTKEKGLGYEFSHDSRK